jgi:membrane-associated phospholipid phosphatase
VNLTLLIILLAVCAILLVAERMGLPTTLHLNFKGDVKRETRWLAQYGQSVNAPIAALLVWQMDPDRQRAGAGAIAILIASFGAAIIGLIVKRLFGRVRPGRDRAGQFLGPTWKHANWRESFPSNHTASAVGMSVVLAALYPPGAVTFWVLAILCAMLRYVLDAHWPSDVLAGFALGYTMAMFALHTLHLS